MQRSWHLDEDKLTFIIQAIPSGADRYSDQVLGGKMLGDVNLFFSQDDDDPSKRRAEVEIMIAESDARRQGVAFNALRLLFLYATSHLNLSVSSFFCKIGAANQKSIALFKKLGFTQVAFSDVWQEAHLQPSEDALDIWSQPSTLVQLHVFTEPLSLAR